MSEGTTVVAEPVPEREMPELSGEESVLTLSDGKRLICPAYPDPCAYVRIEDRYERELLYWEWNEWADDPMGVIGALFGALKTSHDTLVQERRQYIIGQGYDPILWGRLWLTTHYSLTLHPGLEAEIEKSLDYAENHGFDIYEKTEDGYTDTAIIAPATRLMELLGQYALERPIIDFQEGDLEDPFYAEQTQLLDRSLFVVDEDEFEIPEDLQERFR